MVINTGLGKFEYISPSLFTTPRRMAIRRTINPVVRRVIKRTAEKGGTKIFLERYPNLGEDEYIFLFNHGFNVDAQVAIGCIDRNAWLLVGTGDQLEHNPLMIGAFINGFVYVNRERESEKGKQSRKDALKKMEYVLKHGSSVLMFPEGGYNNTENLYIQPLFEGAHKLNCSTGKKVVPGVMYNCKESNRIYVRVGDPIDISKFEPEKGMALVRDIQSSMYYDIILDHWKEALPVIRRDKLKEKIAAEIREKTGAEHVSNEEINYWMHISFMEERYQEYRKAPWTNPNWSEELTMFEPERRTRPITVFKGFGNYGTSCEDEMVKWIREGAKETAKPYDEYDLLDYIKRRWAEDEETRKKAGLKQKVKKLIFRG